MFRPMAIQNWERMSANACREALSSATRKQSSIYACPNIISPVDIFHPSPVLAKWSIRICKMDTKRRGEHVSPCHAPLSGWKLFVLPVSVFKEFRVWASMSEKKEIVVSGMPIRRSALSSSHGSHESKALL